VLVGVLAPAMAGAADEGVLRAAAPLVIRRIEAPAPRPGVDEAGVRPAEPAATSDGAAAVVVRRAAAEPPRDLERQVQDLKRAVESQTREVTRQLEQRDQELGTLRVQVAALQRALEFLVSAMDHAARTGAARPPATITPRADDTARPMPAPEVDPRVGAATPAATPSASTPERARRTHVVQPGESVGGIAARYKTTARAIAEANALPDRDVVAVGAVLVVP
jgi:hypothetical protein